MSENNKSPTKLTKGSKYRVLSKGDSNNNIITIGEFTGYIQFGQDSAIQIVQRGLDPEIEGVTRIIPLTAVLYIDVLDMKEEEEVKKKVSPMVSYG